MSTPTHEQIEEWLRKEAADCTRVIHEWEKADPNSESEILSSFRTELAMYTAAADALESVRKAPKEATNV